MHGNIVICRPTLTVAVTVVTIVTHSVSTCSAEVLDSRQHLAMAQGLTALAHQQVELLVLELDGILVWSYISSCPRLECLQACPAAIA